MLSASGLPVKLHTFIVWYLSACFLAACRTPPVRLASPPPERRISLVTTSSDRLASSGPSPSLFLPSSASPSPSAASRPALRKDGERSRSVARRVSAASELREGGKRKRSRGERERERKRRVERRRGTEEEIGEAATHLHLLWQRPATERAGERGGQREYGRVRGERERVGGAEEEGWGGGVRRPCP